MDYQEFVAKEVENISKSDVFVSLVTENYLKGDCKCALEIGLAILLNKPIRLLVKEGTCVPDNLKKVAEKIAYYKSEEDIAIVGEKLIG